MTVLQSPSVMESSDQQKPYNQPQLKRRQIVNFKQLLKLNIMKKERKEEQARSIKHLRQGKRQSRCKEELGDEKVRMSRDAKIFKEMEVNPTPSRHNKCFLFPSLHLKKDRKLGDAIHDGSIVPSKRVDFFLKIKEFSAQRFNIVTSNSKNLKKRVKETRSIHSQLNLPSKLICRSISPLANASISAQRLSLKEVSEFTNKKSKQEKSTRYQDIPISEFLYDNSSSMRLLEKSLELKMEKAWRKKSKNTRSISVRN